MKPTTTAKPRALPKTVRHNCKKNRVGKKIKFSWGTASTGPKSKQNTSQAVWWQTKITINHQENEFIWSTVAGNFGGIPKKRSAKQMVIIFPFQTHQECHSTSFCKHHRHYHHDHYHRMTTCKLPAWPWTCKPDKKRDWKKKKNEKTTQKHKNGEQRKKPKSLENAKQCAVCVRPPWPRFVLILVVSS